MMNGAFGSSPFIAPWLDFFGGEVGLRISRENMNYLRTIARNKPMLTLLRATSKKHQARRHRVVHEAHARLRHLPSFFDWSPSGLARRAYWDHPGCYERDRDLHRRMPSPWYRRWRRRLGAVDHALLRPACSSSATVRADGIVWLTLLNEYGEARATTLTVDAAALRSTDGALHGPGQWPAVELSGPGHRAHRARSARRRSDDAAARHAAAGRALATGAGREAMELGMTMRAVDANKPPVALPGIRRRSYTRERLTRPGAGARQHRRGAQTAWQWTMLFQPSAAPITSAARRPRTSRARVICACSLVMPGSARASAITRTPTSTCRRGPTTGATLS